jgi:hypothetical protein
MISLTKAEWYTIQERIKTEYPRSVWMIGWKLRAELGFSVRRHVNPDEMVTGEETWYDVPKTTVCLDFYDDQMEVYFRLKYL